MMVMGKIIGALLGLLTAGPLGLLLGAVVGHLFDRALGQAMNFDYGAEREGAQKLFFETTFTVMGSLAKADGRVCEAEISTAEQLMSQMGLTQVHRREAINLFKLGANPDFQLEPQISKFITGCSTLPQLKLVLMEYLVVIAFADGDLHSSERDLLVKVAGYLGIPTAEFERLLSMATAQEQFHHHGQTNYSPEHDLKAAYQALGVSEHTSDKELKRQYRRLMSQHHPDKLMAQGVPEDMLKLGTEKAQEIQAAYDLICRARKASSR